jgi:hypothetical protein
LRKERKVRNYIFTSAAGFICKPEFKAREKPEGMKRRKLRKIVCKRTEKSNYF